MVLRIISFRPGTMFSCKPEEGTKIYAEVKDGRAELEASLGQH